MSDYGVDVPEWEGLPWTWAAERLGAARSYWVASASADGRPHAMPVWAVWDEGEQRLAFSTSAGSRKAANIRANPRVTVAVDSTTEVVALEGRAVVLDDEARKDEWATRYLDKYLAIEPALTREFIVGGMVVEVVPERAFGIIETSEEFATRATRWVFEA
jgi:PPOX class probable F420-dependent enzyme